MKVLSLLLLVGLGGCWHLPDELVGPSIKGVYRFESSCSSGMTGVVSLEIVDPAWGVAELLVGTGTFAIHAIAWSANGEDLLPVFRLRADAATDLFTCAGWDPAQRRGKQRLACSSSTGASCQLDLDYLVGSPEGYRACKGFSAFKQAFDYEGVSCTSLGSGSFTVTREAQGESPSSYAYATATPSNVEVAVLVEYERSACVAGAGMGTISALSQVTFSRPVEGTALEEVFSCRAAIDLVNPTTLNCDRSYGGSSSTETCSIRVTPR